MKAVTAVAIADDAEVEEVPLGLASSSFLAGVEDGSTGSVRGDDKAPSPLPSDSDEIDADSRLEMFTQGIFVCGA